MITIESPCIITFYIGQEVISEWTTFFSSFEPMYYGLQITIMFWGLIYVLGEPLHLNLHSVQNDPMTMSPTTMCLK